MKTKIITFALLLISATLFSQKIEIDGDSEMFVFTDLTNGFVKKRASARIFPHELSNGNISLRVENGSTDGAPFYNRSYAWDEFRQFDDTPFANKAALDTWFLDNVGKSKASGGSGAGTDDQNISGSGLSGTNLTIGIEDGTNEVVDLAPLTAGLGNVTKVGTPEDSQIVVWTGDGTAEGADDLVWDGTRLRIVGATVPNALTVGEATTVMEDIDGILQFISSNSLSYASGLVLTSAPPTGNNHHWGMLVGGVNADDNFSIRYNSADTDNQSVAQFNGDEIMTFLKTGEVGIGKTNPATALDVNGTITSTEFSGGGSNLTGLTESQITDLSHTVNTDDQTAAEVTYDNATSGLTATTVQGMGDELAAEINFDATYRTVTYGATVTDTYDEDQPNFRIVLAGNIDLGVGTITEGGGMVTLIRSDYDDAIDLETQSGVLTGSHAYSTTELAVRLTYYYENGSVMWYCNNCERTTPRVSTVATGATITPVESTTDMFTVTALDTNATIAAPTGTPEDGQALLIRVKDDGTSRTLAWNAIYRESSDFALPTATVISETFYIQFLYNSADSTWDAVGLTQGF